MVKDIEKLAVIPLNTSVNEGMLKEVVDTLRTEYSSRYTNVELLPRRIVTPETHPELFHKQFDELSIGVDTNTFKRHPAVIFQYLQMPDKRVLAITDLPLYDPLQDNGFNKGMNGMIEPECNAGILTTRKLIGELALTPYQKFKALVTHGDPSFKRRLKRLLTNSNKLFLDKLKSLAVHETGHFDGLEHCMETIEPTGLLCAMADSWYLSVDRSRIGWTKSHDYDLRGYSLCPDCKDKLK